MSASAKVFQLQQILVDRFGSADGAAREVYPTGVPALDEVGIPRGAVTEIVSPATGPGGTLLLYGLLHALVQKGEEVVLIDGQDAFAPGGLPQTDLVRLLWIRCPGAGEAIRAADLTVRDGNIPVVVLLLLLNPLAELRRIPATAWHRLQMLAEKSAVTVLVFSPQAQVGCARLRLSVSGTFPLGKLHRGRGELWPGLSLGVERRRAGWERGMDAEIRRAAGA